MAWIKSRINYLFLQKNSEGGGGQLFLNYIVTYLHHISKVELYFIQDESERKTCIFHFKTIILNTHSSQVVRIIQKYATNSSNSEKILETRSVQQMMRGNLLIDFTLTLIINDVICSKVFEFVVRYFINNVHCQIRMNVCEIYWVIIYIIYIYLSALFC